MDFIKKHIEWLPTLIIVAILGMTLPSKFGGAAQTDHIFSVVGQFLGLDFFSSNGAIITGSLELIAVILVLMPKTRGIGALLASGLMAGAIFFHLASPLGMTMKWQENGVMMEDGAMFYMAIIVFLSGLYLLMRNKGQVMSLIGKE